METSIHSKNINLSTLERTYAVAEARDAKKAQETVIGNPENYYGVIAITLLAGSMIGGLVAYIVLAYNANNFLFALNVGAAMANNVASIAQLEYKTVLRVFYITTLINLLVMGIVVLS